MNQRSQLALRSNVHLREYYGTKYHHIQHLWSKHIQEHLQAIKSNIFIKFNQHRCFCPKETYRAGRLERVLDVLPYSYPSRKVRSYSITRVHYINRVSYRSPF